MNSAQYNNYHDSRTKEVMQWDAVHFISDWNLTEEDWVMDMQSRTIDIDFAMWPSWIEGQTNTILPVP